MGRSARVLGWEFGKTAQEMNLLLKEHGYLDGEPGAYGLTEKGQQYAKEQEHHRGTGGYAHYNRIWETRTWNDETTAALRSDMEAKRDSPDLEALTTEDCDALDYIPCVDHDTPVDYGSTEDDDPQLTWKDLAIGGAIVGALLAAPHVKLLWNKRLKPAVQKVRERLTMRPPVEAGSADATKQDQSPQARHP